MPSLAIRVRRVSGEVLECELRDQVLDDLRTVAELKVVLAAADPTRPVDPQGILATVCVRLLQGGPGNPPTSVELSDNAAIPWEALRADSSLPPLTYVVTYDIDTINLKLEEMVADIDPRYVKAGMPAALPATLDGSRIPRTEFPNFMLYEHVSESLYLMIATDDPVALPLWNLWRSAILYMPSSIANKKHADGTTVLVGMIRFYRNVPFDGLQDKIEQTTVEFLQRQDLEPSMINSMVSQVSHYDRSMVFDDQSVYPALFLSLREKKARRNGRSTGQCSGNVAMELLTVWADKTPEVLSVTGKNGDTMLHHILEPSSLVHAYDKSHLEAQLCESLASKLSFRQLCHRNNEGICALSYAETLVAATRDSPDWVRVRDAIKAQMILRCRADTLPLQEILETIQNLQNAVTSADQYQFEDLDTAHLIEVMNTMREVAWQSAAKIRRQWLDRGWQFMTRTTDLQVSEVIGHFDHIPLRVEEVD